MSGYKILYFVTEDWYFCSHRLPLAVAAKEAGYDVIVVTRVRNHGDVIRQAGLRLIPIELSRRGINPFTEFQLVLRLVSIYRHEKPDIVHHVAMKPALHGSLAALISNVRNTVNALAGLGWLFSSRSKGAKFLSTIVSIVFRILLNRGQVIVQNPDDQQFLLHLGIKESRLNLIRGSGVDIHLFIPQPEPFGVFTVILATRMLWDKGVGEFVEAARILRSRGVNARFVLVGDSDTENRAAIAQQQLKAWDDEKVIEWWGQRNDMPEVFASSHLVCLPSYYREGIPKVLLEAAACGRALISTDTPGCREIVRHGVNGVLVPIRDPNALADAIESLFNNDSLRHTMAAKSIEIAQAEFSQERVIADTFNVYRKLLN
jgi:glycosyltransferase involved in cell wall biosynthesis